MKQEISQTRKGIDFTSYDSIVIKKHITDIEGGRTLDMTGFPLDVVFAAHVIISKTTDGEKVYLPMPLKDTGEVDDNGDKIYAYDTLPQSAVIEGVLYRSISKDKPAASILIDGVVNDMVMKYQLGALAEAFKAACPQIIFNHDEEA